MTLRPDLALLLAAALALTGCEREADGRPGSDDWRSLLAAHDGAAAEAALRRAIEKGASAADLAPYMAEAEMQQGDLIEADRWLSGGEFTPEAAAHGYHMIGRLRMLRGDLPGAGQAFDKALTVDPESAGLWVDIGRLRWRGGEQAQAVEASVNAVAFGPDNPAALLFRGQLVRDSRGNLEALPFFEKGLAATPWDRELLAEYAATLGELGRATDMLTVTRRLAEAAPDDPRALYLQAVLAARAGNFDLSRNLLQRVGQQDRPDAAVTVLHAIVDMENGNYDSAAQDLDGLAQRQPRNDRVRLLLARALALGGNDRELVARFGDRMDSPYLAMLVGQAYEALGQRDKAAPWIDFAQNGGSMRILALKGPADTDIPGAFLASHPGSADAMALAGDAALAAGNAAKAEALYRRSATIRTIWPLVQRWAAALDRTGRQREATSLIARHLSGAPANADAAAVLARRLFDRGDETGARVLVAYAKSRGRNDPVLDRLIEG